MALFCFEKLGRFGTIWDFLERFEIFYVVISYCIRMRMEVFRILPWIQQAGGQPLIAGCPFFMQRKSCAQIVDRLLISPGEKVPEKWLHKNGEMDAYDAFFSRFAAVI